MPTSGVGEMKKSYDAEAKGNVYQLEGHKVMMPPLGPDHGGRASLNITHRYLVFQIFIAAGDHFQIELAIRDKGSVRFILENLTKLVQKTPYVYRRSQRNSLQRHARKNTERLYCTRVVAQFVH